MVMKNNITLKILKVIYEGKKQYRRINSDHNYHKLIKNHTIKKKKLKKFFDFN